jgi:hypothetical protein
MKVCDVLACCAGMFDGLNLNDEIVLKDLEMCYNLVECDLATFYFPLIAKEKIKMNNNIFKYKHFKKKPTRIIKCTNGGKPLRYRIFPEWLYANADEITVKYSYYPDYKGLDSVCDYDTRYLKIMAYGVISEYCLYKGIIEYSELYAKEFKKLVNKKLGGIKGEERKDIR